MDVINRLGTVARCPTHVRTGIITPADTGRLLTLASLCNAVWICHRPAELAGGGGDQRFDGLTDGRKVGWNNCQRNGW
jgi:hypothetical protein